MMTARRGGILVGRGKASTECRADSSRRVGSSQGMSRELRRVTTGKSHLGDGSNSGEN